MNDVEFRRISNRHVTCYPVRTLRPYWVSYDNLKKTCPQPGQYGREEAVTLVGRNKKHPNVGI